ncbi:MAG TPA: hypothetical protein VMF65_06875 [Acidimicrobiales bacterium]|nr:hypothetical protein [Acidimicrobiales bacterium]
MIRPTRSLPIFAVALGVTAAMGVPAVAATVSLVQYGFSFSLPPKWTQIPLDSSDISSLISAATRGDPALENVLDQQVVQASKKGLKVFAVGPISGGFFPSLNVAVASAASMPSGPNQYSLMASEVKIILTEAGATEMKVATAHTHLGEVVQASYKLEVKSASHTVPVYEMQSYVVHGPRLYVVTFAATTAAGTATEARVVEGSWHWQAGQK